jgi:methyltransferase-like protein 6
MDKWYFSMKNETYYHKDEFNFGVTEWNLKPLVLEMGCGVGNSLFPLMANNPDKYFYAFDCSPTAIEIVKKSQEYNESRCKVFLCDIVKEELPQEIRVEKFDIVLSIFCLSAIAPEHMPSVLRKIYTVTLFFCLSKSFK